ncbi:hypothetical protein M422DRAFT_275750 [Sphaerobolus stellatus SS14]|uniref:Uncharacterized protein n=1 Tax=Sphaerobolus stellatus (strain SS14) TaxID=990650 RepID=A0A0C9T424_SPHS4|nr:hypothetical protein M422DRAFT_275750 [Sphaerobolus stellatus SS14]
MQVTVPQLVWGRSSTIKVWAPVKKTNSSIADLYLFVEDPIILLKEAGHKRSEVYWSKCPGGTTRVTTCELYAIGIERAPVV